MRRNLKIYWLNFAVVLSVLAGSAVWQARGVDKGSLVETPDEISEARACALMLRETLETDNRSATLDLTDFDDRPLRIEAHPRHFGRGFAQLRANGAAVPWPQEAAPPVILREAVTSPAGTAPKRGLCQRSRISAPTSV